MFNLLHKVIKVLKIIFPYPTSFRNSLFYYFRLNSFPNPLIIHTLLHFINNNLNLNRAIIKSIYLAYLENQRHCRCVPLRSLLLLLLLLSYYCNLERLILCSVILISLNTNSPSYPLALSSSIISLGVIGARTGLV